MVIQNSLKENANVNTTFCGVLWCCEGSQNPDDQKCGVSEGRHVSRQGENGIVSD